MTIAEQHDSEQYHVGNSGDIRLSLRALLGSQASCIEDAFELHETIRAGFPFTEVLRYLSSTVVARDEALLAEVLGMTRRTLQRRKKQPEALTADQSSRVWRFVDTLERATVVLGSRQAAEEWLTRPAMGLERRRPVDLLLTDVGHQLVDELLTRMEYGVYH